MEEEVLEVTQEREPMPREELMDFVRAHPGLDPNQIPGEVWEAVREGESLEKAYGRYEMEQLRRSNADLQQRLHIRSRSLGSMRSTGGSRKADSFLAGFNED